MTPGLFRCWIDLLALYSLSRMLWIELRLPQLERDIHPGKLLLSLHLEFDQVRLCVYHQLNQLTLLNRIEEDIVGGAQIVLFKTDSGCRSQQEGRRRKGASMRRSCSPTAKVQAHLAVGKGPGRALGIEGICD